MSLANNKGALFDLNSAPSKNLATSGVKPKVSVGGRVLGGTALGASRLSPEMRAKKAKEAKEYMEKGREYLKTSVWQWNPDHMGAAGYFEKASNAWKAAGDIQESFDMLVQTSNCHKGYGSLQSAANSLFHAAKLAESLIDNKEKGIGIKTYSSAADLWEQCGDIDKSAECYSHAATQAEDSDYPEVALDLHQRACDMLCPKESTDEEMKRCNIRSIDIMRNYFNFLIKTEDQYPRAIVHAQHLAKFYKAWEIDTSLCKLLCAITILQLLMKDVVTADQTYLQEHLSISVYLTSKESDIAENLITAFKTYNMELLTSTVRGESISYLDREVQYLVKKLKMSGSKPAPAQEPKIEITVDLASATTDLKTTSNNAEVGGDDDDDDIDLL